VALAFRGVSTDNPKMKAAFIAVVVAVATTAAGCGGTSTSGTPGGAEFVPASVAAFVRIDSDPDSSQWRHADELSHRFPGRDDAVKSLEDDLRSDSSLDFEQDIEPALGAEVDVVWLDFERDGENVVALTQPRDVAAFERAIAKGNANDPTNEVVYEQVEGWEVLSDEQAKIDAFKAALAAGGPALADDPEFEQAMAEHSSDAIVKAYVSGAKAMAKLRASVPANQKSEIEKLGTLEWFVTAVSTSSEGVRLEATVRGAAGELLRSSAGGGGGFELSLPKDIPGDVLAYIGFHGTAGSLSGLETNPALASPELKPVRSILRQVESLLMGENALYVRPSEGDLPEITLVTEPGAGKDGAARLDAILADLEIGGIERKPIAGTEAREIELGGGIRLAYANVGDRLVVTDTPAGIEGVAQPGSGLAASTPFRDAVDTSGMPDNVESFVWVDVQGGLGLVEKLSDAPVPDSVKRNLGPLRSVVEYAASRPSEVRITLFVKID
jgi:hypothetical protein